MQDPRLTFDAILPMIAAAVLAAAVVFIAWRRRLSLPMASKLLAALGLLLLVLAAGLPHWRRAVAGEVAVLVDLSPSTRSATFRDRTMVEQRARQLLGDTPFRIYRFGDGLATSDTGEPWAELPSPVTRFDPPPAAAILLFSDGQFDLPASAPPVFTVIDPALAQAADGRIASLAIEGPEAVATAVVETPRLMTWSGVSGDARTTALQPGRVVLRQPIESDAGDKAGAAIDVRLSLGDLWPENDALTILPPPPPRAERWFITNGASAPAGYRRITPADLPTEATAYLATSAIVLDNIFASALPTGAHNRLTQFVRDLGGGLMIVGGDRAFAAGGYVGTPIDALSPLASVPPRPASHWMLLTDGSGSMNAPATTAGGAAGESTRWQAATAALIRLLPSLPPDDPADLGSFAADVTWWTGATSFRPAKELASLALPPAGVSPSGPTNLRSAIEVAARRHDPALPGHLLILSDADADIGDLASLVDLLKSRRIKLHLLAVGDGRGLKDLGSVVEQTGGTIVRQTDAGQWADAAAQLLRSAAEKHLMTNAVEVRFAHELSALPSRQVSLWNRTWLKPRATLLAEAPPGTAPAAGETVPMAAIWQVGEGRVAAVAFGANDVEQSAAVNLIATPTRDPRINVTVAPGGRLNVRVDAIDHQAPATEQFLNGLTLSLELSSLDNVGTPGLAEPILQTAPGRYEAVVNAPTRPMLATVRHGERAVTRFAVAGRYPREFDTIGINRDNLQRLVERFGGGVIEPDRTTPIDFNWPLQATPIAPWLAAAGALALVGALLWWRWA